MILETSAIGSVALELLIEGKKFTVHSIFEKGWNIIDCNEELIFLGTDENGTFPFGILLDPQTKQKVKAEIEVGDTFIVRNKRLSHNRLDIKFDDTKILPLNTDFEHANINMLKENMQQISFNSYESTDFELKRVTELICKLQDSSGNLEDEFRYFIGRGQGLTPTGDDILVGILYGHFINPFIAANHLETLEKLIEEPLTTVVSKRFLTCALKGLFSSKITQLQHDSSLESLKSLMEVGSSSGKDTLYGIWMALKKE
ncbi:DUF2877 domain-containing protein [Oceanobacillus neutriphilus]|uniref:DUF2877 domain-containing protein n=1 Tax=Oceanobacillus neutriphilus TaxID=531815 RepID=A0ABQ2NXN7_9BACI|nr:DUF2877 domain-containing protein [Oceanobacillus neutriphilus]GGP13121.1 hypothetical protein GCM10011346_31830 [Oceanobacillus neutriphilus]